MPQFDHTTRPSRDWLHALQTASNDLRHLVDGLSTEDLSLASRDGDWTVAQVLSHLGSAAEICTDLVRRGLAGDHRGPQRDELTPIWDRWNDLGLPSNGCSGSERTPPTSNCSQASPSSRRNRYGSPTSPARWT